MSIISVIVTLFVTLNALGNIPLFIAMLKDFEPSKQRTIIIRELSVALLIMLIFSYFGDGVLEILNVNIPILRVAGGMLLFLISMDLVFPKERSPTEAIKEEPFIVPLAIPIVTGPATISMVMVFSHEIQNQFIMVFCIFMAWLPSITALLLASFLKRVLGEKVLLGFERIAGLILTFISVQMFTTGLREFIEAL